jgi:hypothetical protein
MPLATTIPMTTSPVVRLIKALRSPPPEEFVWDFRRYRQCALGLAEQMGFSPVHLLDAIPPGGIVQVFDNPFCSIQNVDGLVPLYGVPASDVTPAMVADALERLVSAKGR